MRGAAQLLMIPGRRSLNQSSPTTSGWSIARSLPSDGRISRTALITDSSEDLLAEAADSAQETAKRLMPDSEITAMPAQGEWMNGLAIKLDGRPEELFHRWLAKRLSALRLAYAVQDKATFLAALKEDMGRLRPRRECIHTSRRWRWRVTATLQVAQLALDGLRLNAAEANLAWRGASWRPRKRARRCGSSSPVPKARTGTRCSPPLADLGVEAAARTRVPGNNLP